ncbi:MAG TPA: hypothetical protein VGR89_03745, partial [Puia sp.]|nr:hypothetical protein [Puia sp.]
MLFFSTYITPRLNYVLDFFGKELFDDPSVIHVTDNKDAVLAAQGPRINYSNEDVPGCFTVRPSGLLFETGVHPLDVVCSKSGGQPVLFPTGGDFSFDVFAASFYLLSRYEEYLPHPKDEYGRFAHTHSLAFREGFLDQPVINIWLMELRRALAARFPGLVFRYAVFKFIPTYDIDSAFSYLYKGWGRNLGGLLRSVITGQWKKAFDRIETLRRRRKDPFDVYEWLDSLHLYCRMRPYYFFLAAGRIQGVDRNIPISSRGLQDLIRYHSAGSRLGIHPSWQSGDDERLLKEEIEWMSYVSGQKVVRSRQHYVRFVLPTTYRLLIQYGIEQDFSMGYGSINGFRASVASSFYWYDLEKETATRLR